MREDVKRALDEFGNFLVSKKQIEKAEELLENDETVIYVSSTNFKETSISSKKTNTSVGIIFLTSKRVLFVCKTWYESKLESIALGEIRSTNSHTDNVSGGHITFQTLTKSYDILVTYERNAVQKIHSVFSNAIDISKAKTTSAVSPADELIKWKSLLDIGAITQDEYEKKKKSLLNL